MSDTFPVRLLQMHPHHFGFLINGSFDMMTSSGLIVRVIFSPSSFPINGVMISDMAIPWSVLRAEEIERAGKSPALVTPSEMQPLVISELSEFVQEREIDSVTTPRGCTIAGLNEMEHQGFSSAMIKGILLSAEKAEGLYDE